jgi:mRNA interferase MazF
MRRGDIYSVNWGTRRVWRTSLFRPGLILTNNAANERLPHLMLAPLTTNVTRLYPFDVLLPLGSSGVLEVSKVQLNYLRGMVRTRLGAYLGSVPSDLMLEINAKLRNHLDL